MDRTQRLLAGLLVVQMAVLGILHNPFASGGGATDAALLPALASMTPAKIEIDDGKGGAVALTRGGDSWRLGEPAGYPAATERVEKLIEDLEQLDARRPVVSGNRYHAALKVADADYERRVRIWEKTSGGPSLELFVGTSPSYRVSHARVGGKDRVYEVSGVQSYDLGIDPGSWVDRTLVSIPVDEVTGIELANRHGSFALEKKDGGWAVRAPAVRASAALDADQVSALVRSVATLSLNEPAGTLDEKTQGFSDPEATVVIEHAKPGADTTAAPPTRTTIQIGATVEGKEERYATRSGFGFAVAISKYTADRVLDQKLADLLTK